MTTDQLAASAGERDRAIFDAGFAACRAYGDNHFHYRGEQADRVFAKAMEKIGAHVAEGAGLPMVGVLSVAGRRAVVKGNCHQFYIGDYDNPSSNEYFSRSGEWIKVRWPSEANQVLWWDESHAIAHIHAHADKEKQG